MVIDPETKFRLDERGRRKLGDDGEELPPLWYPLRLHAVDVVDTGDATRAFLGVEGLPDGIVRAGTQLLDQQFPDAPPDVIRARCLSWLDKYLGLRFPDDLPVMAGDPEVSRRRLRRKYPGCV